MIFQCKWDRRIVFGRSILTFSAVIGVVLVLSCIKAVDPDESYTCTWNGQDSIDYLESVTCPDDFNRLQGKPLTQLYGEVKSVKVVYDIQADSLYFIDSRKYALHYDFCKQVLGYPKDHKEFNREQYSQSDARVYHLPSVSFYTASHIYTIEFASGDQISSQQIKNIYERVEEHVFFGEEMRFLPTSTTLQSRALELSGVIPVVYDEEIYAGQNYQPLNREKTYGYLVKVDSDSITRTYLGRHDIVLTNAVPNDIPVVAGIITTDFQTPLSHINVLSQNRGTPNMGLRDGWTNQRISPMINKLVYLEVKLDTFAIRQANLDEAQAFWAQKEPSDTTILECWDDSAGLYEMALLNHASTPLVGAKAANFAEMTHINAPDPGPIPTPKAFAVPVSYYRQHIRENNLESMVEEILNDSLLKIDVDRRRQRLQQIRDSIVNAPINQIFLNLVLEKLANDYHGARMRFRSSTNAEDLPGFNGAGLYSSYSGEVGDPNSPVDEAIKKVWASLWNFRAFEEREYFKIDHRSVAMGILVHRAFPNEAANGVAITRNIYNPNLWGITINAQIGEVSVVRPPRGFTSDQIVFYTFYEDPFESPVIEYISHSNVNDGNPVLTQEEIVKLTKYLLTIKTHFYFIYGNWSSFPGFAMDVEFKFDYPDRTLYIKQARPY